MGLIKGGNLDLDAHRGRTPCEQGTPKTARKPPEASGEAWTGFSLRASRRNQTFQHLHPAPAFGLFTLRSCETISVAQATALCYFVTAAPGNKHRVCLVSQTLAFRVDVEHRSEVRRRLLGSRTLACMCPGQSSPRFQWTLLNTARAALCLL